MVDPAALIMPASGSGGGSDFSQQMWTMARFRSVAVHDYRKLSLEVVKSILENHLDEFYAFTAATITVELRLS